MPSEFLSGVPAMLLPFVGYGVMSYVLVETISDAHFARKVAHAAKQMQTQLEELHLQMCRNDTKPSAIDSEVRALQDDVATFDSQSVTAATDRVAMWYDMAPLLGMLFTTVTLWIKLPDAYALIQNDPASFYRGIGVAVGTTALGMLSASIAIYATRKLESERSHLERMFGPLEPSW